MCGIAGFVPAPRRRVGVEELRRVGDRMAASLAHRGPDGNGVWVADDGALVLAHRRLAVVGLGPSGNQPMRARSGRHVITYNGELYNAPAIGRRLEDAGAVFRGTSDTEVLLEAIDRWGTHDALVAADGMFALAVWDERDRSLTLARDRMGEKPLAYGVVDGGLAFTSELQALRVVPGFRTQLDPSAMEQYLRFACVPAPSTVYAGVRKLPPGTLLRIDAAEPSVLEVPQPYWSTLAEWEAGARSPFTDEQAMLDELDGVAAEAVRSRLRSDVPLGVFLSGGIDSTLVATMAAEQLDRPVRTFTIASDDPDHDESAQARAVASRLGADHTELTVTAADALAEVPTLADAFDEPFGDSSALPTLLVAKLARQHVTVTLSGDGGDELFGGYNRHVWLPATWRRVGRWPATVRRTAGWLLPGRPRSAGTSWRDWCREPSAPPRRCQGREARPGSRRRRRTRRLRTVRVDVAGSGGGGRAAIRRRIRRRQRRPVAGGQLLDRPADGRRCRYLPARRRADEGRPGDDGREPRGPGAAACPGGRPPRRPAARSDARATAAAESGRCASCCYGAILATSSSDRSPALACQSPTGCVARCVRGPRTCCRRPASTLPACSAQRPSAPHGRPTSTGAETPPTSCGRC